MNEHRATRIAEKVHATTFSLSFEKHHDGKRAKTDAQRAETAFWLVVDIDDEPYHLEDSTYGNDSP